LFFDPGEEPELGCHPDAETCVPGDCRLYAEQHYRRRILPPMLSALPWRAVWDEPEVHDGETRTMVLEAPGLPPGETIDFEIVQEGFGTIGQVSAVSEDGRAAVPWSEWYIDDAVDPCGDLEPGEAFPVVRYTFVATGGGRRIECRAPLAYADRAWLELVVDGTHLLANEPYRLCSPWGTRRGTTDEHGVLDERDLPPGGASIMIRDRVLVHFGKLYLESDGDA